MNPIIPLLVIIICGVVMAGFPFYSFIMCLFSDELTGSQKILWALFIIIVSPLGSVLYSIYHPHNNFHVWFGRTYIFIALVGLIIVLFGPKPEKPAALNEHRTPQIMFVVNS